jgi:hypothetical protein
LDSATEALRELAAGTHPLAEIREALPVPLVGRKPLYKMEKNAATEERSDSNTQSQQRLGLSCFWFCPRKSAPLEMSDLHIPFGITHYHASIGLIGRRRGTERYRRCPVDHQPQIDRRNGENWGQSRSSRCRDRRSPSNDTPSGRVDHADPISKAMRRRDTQLQNRKFRDSVPNGLVMQFASRFFNLSSICVIKENLGMPEGFVPRMAIALGLGAWLVFLVASFHPACHAYRSTPDVSGYVPIITHGFKLYQPKFWYLFGPSFFALVLGLVFIFVRGLRIGGSQSLSTRVYVAGVVSFFALLVAFQHSSFWLDAAKAAHWHGRASIDGFVGAVCLVWDW